MSSLTLTFVQPGEEAIVLKALTDAYGRVAELMEADRAAAGDDLEKLLTIASIADRCQERIAKLSKRWQRVCERIAKEDPEEVGAGVGRSPTDKGHGCPALLLAVGSALELSQGGDITSPGGALFCASDRQELPVGQTLPHTRSQREETL